MWISFNKLQTSNLADCYRSLTVQQGEFLINFSCIHVGCDKVILLLNLQRFFKAMCEWTGWENCINLIYIIHDAVKTVYIIPHCARWLFSKILLDIAGKINGYKKDSHSITFLDFSYQYRLTLSNFGGQSILLILLLDTNTSLYPNDIEVSPIRSEVDLCLK